MIDFSKLECQVASGAAVGIGVDENNKSTFYLPIGYTALTTADEKKQAFFELYRLFKAYVAKNNLDTVKDTRSSQNGTVAKNDGYKLAVKDDDSETMLHTKVNFLDTIIDAFDPYAIQNIANRKLYSEEFELEDALNHLDDAVFMPNHAFMVDQAIVDKKQLVIEASELAQMFCFIYCDVKTQLQEEDQIDAQYRYLANLFKELHLFPQASLFEQDSFEQVKTILKDRLELIDHNTPIKDGEYWKLRDAIYAFLYGEPVKGLSDTYWGIKNFWPIWEDLCLEAVSKSKLNDKAWLADTKRDDLFNPTKKIGNKNIFFKDNDDDYPFKIKLGDQVKYLYPDAIFVFTYDPKLRFNDQNTTSERYYWNNSIFREELIKFYNMHPAKGSGNPTISLIESKFDKAIFSYIDFKYKSKTSPDDARIRDVIKQNFYLLCDKRFSIAEFWLPCGDGVDCNNAVPQELDDFKDNTRKDIKTRKINIQNLVKRYIGG
jgi:hypothetical protein